MLSSASLLDFDCRLRTRLDPLLSLHFLLLFPSRHRTGSLLLSSGPDAPFAQLGQGWQDVDWTPGRMSLLHLQRDFPVCSPANHRHSQRMSQACKPHCLKTPDIFFLQRIDVRLFWLLSLSGSGFSSTSLQSQGKTGDFKKKKASSDSHRIT
ncbi:unnamed protein product [Natator depressus]